MRITRSSSGRIQPFAGSWASQMPHDQVHVCTFTLTAANPCHATPSNPDTVLSPLSGCCVYLGESRHDIFVEIHSGYFQKGTKKADKNIEVQVSVVDKNGKAVEVCTVCGLLVCSSIQIGHVWLCWMHMLIYTECVCVLSCPNHVGPDFMWARDRSPKRVQDRHLLSLCPVHLY